MSVVRAAAAILSVVTAGALAACGTAPPMTASAARELSGAVQAVRSAALAGNPSLAESDLASLRANVASLEKAGELSPARAKAILAAASNVMAQLTLFSSTTTTTVSPFPPGGSSQSSPGQGHDHQGHSGDKKHKSDKNGGGD